MKTEKGGPYSTQVVNVTKQYTFSLISYHKRTAMRRYENQQLQDRGVCHFSVIPFLQLYLQKQNFVTIVFGSFWNSYFPKQATSMAKFLYTVNFQFKVDLCYTVKLCHNS